MDFENKISILKDTFIKRYTAQYVEDNHIKGNKFEKQFIKLEEELFLMKGGIEAMKSLLLDDNEIVRYYSACALISVYPELCKKVLTRINNGYLKTSVKYVILNYDNGDNYFSNFLKINNIIC